MVYINPMNVITLLLAAFNSLEKSETPINNAELELKNVLYDIIVQTMENPYFNVEEETCLDLDDQFEESEIQAANLDWIEEDDLDIPHDEIIEEIETCAPSEETATFDYKTHAVEYWKSGQTKRLKLETVQSRFRKVKSVRQLRKWEAQVQMGGSRYDKLVRIADYTFNNLKDAIQSNIIVHDVDIKRWALQAKAAENLPSFTASRTWVNKFKRAHGIVSRKITKFVTKSSVGNEDETFLKCQEFVEQVESHILQHGAENVFNSDQSGFNLEIHSGRTLAVKGSKTVEAVVQSVSSTTHSYTIQPTVSADGKLLSPLFIVLKEASGTFGPRVQQTMFTAENIFVTASKSGKLTKEHFKTWLQEVYFPSTNQKTALLLDSWSGHCERTIQQVTPPDKEIKVFTIPAGTTKYIQPLDVYGFRMWKNFVRRFSNAAILLHYDVKLYARDNILKLQSLIHNQFSSPRFQNFLKYSWYKSGYVAEKPPVFENPIEYCFASENEPRCHVCDNVAIITCAWCKKSLCLKHFFED